MNKPEKIELSGFVTTETRQGRRRFNRGSMQKGGRGRKRSGSFTSSGASSMLLKLGICAAACALVLLIKWVDTPLTNSALESIKEIIDDGKSEMEEPAGKLKFVELPGLLSVFAQKGDMAAPVEFSRSELLEDGNLARFFSQSSAAVICVKDGRVKSVGQDASLGKYVMVSHDNDITTVYYGLDEIIVEEGQPLRRLDNLGKLGADGVLSMAITKGGKPQDVSKYIDMQGNG